MSDSAETKTSPERPMPTVSAGWLVSARRGLARRYLDWLDRHWELKVWYWRVLSFLGTYGWSPYGLRSAEPSERRWRDQGTDRSPFKPEMYIHEDDQIPALFQDVLPFLDTQSRILEIGCNAGRNLNWLYQRGYTNLAGIEIGAEAVKLFAKQFPDAYRHTNVIVGNAADEIGRLETGGYDLVFTRGVLVNISVRHNHIFREICRVCRGYVVTMETEHCYTGWPRNFERMFSRHGFDMVAYRFLVRRSPDARIEIPRRLTRKDFFSCSIMRVFAKFDRTCPNGEEGSDGGR